MPYSLKYIETPVIELYLKEALDKGLRLFIKREDLNHPSASGNKFWKLKYNLEEALLQKKNTVLTFGGAFSNHIYATSAATNELELKNIGVIRGEETQPLNSTLSFAKSKGMVLHYVSRETYRKKKENGFLEELKKRFGDFYLIPEGGSNDLAVKGCEELGEKIRKEVEFDYVCLPVGTGGTMAGIIAGLKGQKEIIGFPVLKNGDFLKHEIELLLEKHGAKLYENWRLLTSYHHGGYAKVTRELMDFIQRMKEEHNLPLDPVYTGKLLYGVKEEIKKGSFSKGSTILVIHTGGLQPW